MNQYGSLGVPQTPKSCDALIEVFKFIRYVLKKLHVWTYSIIRFTLRFVNLFGEFSPLCAIAAASGTKNGNFIIGLRLNCRFSLWSRNNSETILDWGNTIIIMRSASIFVCLSYISNLSKFSCSLIRFVLFDIYLNWKSIKVTISDENSP